MPVIEHVLGRERAHFYRRGMHRRSVVLAGWLDGLPAAAVLVSWEPADEPAVRRHLKGVPFLHRLYVRDDLRDRGYGSRLLSAAEALLSDLGHEQVASGVDLDNERALALYDKRGYRDWGHGHVVTTREVYRPDGAVAVVPDRCRIVVKNLTWQ